jgi:hypothetical protein
VAFVSPLILAVAPRDSSLAGEAEGMPVGFRWRVPVVHKQTVEDGLRFEGVIEPEKDKKGALVFVFVGLVLLPYLAKSILELMRQVEHGGVFVDACGPELEIETDKRMPNGMVVVRSCNDADVKVYRDDIEGPSQLAGFIEKAMRAK